MSVNQDDTRYDGALYHAIWEYSSDPVAILDADLTFRPVSPSYTSSLGYASAQLMGVHALSLVHPVDRTLMESVLSSLQPGAVPQIVHFRHQHADGTLQIESSPGTGTRVSARLPFSDEP